MGAYSIEAKIYAHKNVHESRKKFMRPSEQEVEERLTYDFFELISKPELMNYAGLAVEDWEISPVDFTRKFENFVRKINIEIDEDFDKCGVALLCLSDCAVAEDKVTKYFLVCKNISLEIYCQTSSQGLISDEKVGNHGSIMNIRAVRRKHLKLQTIYIFALRRPLWS